MKKKIFKNKNKGYTIIETMFAVSLFLVITMAGMAALLNANLIHKKSQNMRSSLDNLNFIMEDISRNLRVGHSYRCISGTFSAVNISDPQDCTGKAIAFENDLGNDDPNDPDAYKDQWAYKIESTRTDATGNSIYDISKSTDGGTTWVQLNPDEISIDPTSSFSVSGSLPPPDPSQPFATIKLKGTITLKNVVTPFSLQTSVSQRVVDI